MVPPVDAWSGHFVGRDEELARLRAAWQSARAGNAELVVLLAESGMGKTRLVQEFYSWMSQHEDAPDPDGYWPDWLERDRNSLSINPAFSPTDPAPALPWLWWGVRFNNPGLRNRAEVAQCGLVASLPLLAPHFLPLQRAKEVRSESKALGLGTLGALVGLLGLASLGPVAGGVVAGLSALGALKDKVDLLRSARKLYDLRRDASGAVATRAAEDQADALERVHAYFGALLDQGPEGRGGVPVVLVIDDAQWIDPDTLGFLDRLFEDARRQGWPLLVVCTHWEREWRTAWDSPTDEGSLAAWTRRRRDLLPEAWAPTPVGKVSSAALDVVLRAALPGLNAVQRERVLDRVDGNPGFLFDLITVLTTSKRRFFVGSDPSNPLKPGAESHLATLTALDHYQLNVQRFADLDADLRALLAWASYQGTRFVDDLTLEAALRLEDVESGNLATARTPYGLIERVSHLSHEFRQRTIHEIALAELKEIEEEFDAFREALVDVLAQWFASGRLLELETVEREQLLLLLAHELEVPSSPRASGHASLLGPVLAALVDHYTADGQGRQAAGAAARLLSAMPAEGWLLSSVPVRIWSAAASALDRWLMLDEGARLRHALVERLEEAVGQDPDPLQQARLFGELVQQADATAEAGRLRLGPWADASQHAQRAAAWATALDTSARAVAGLEALGDPQPGFRRLRAEALRAHADILRALERPSEARQHYEAAIAAMESTPYDPGDAQGMASLKALAGYHLACGRLLAGSGGEDEEAAESHLLTAFGILGHAFEHPERVESEELWREFAEAAETMAQYLADAGRNEESLEYFTAAERLIAWPTDDADQDRAPHEHAHFAGLLQNHARVLLRLDRGEDAWTRADRALHLLEALRDRMGAAWPRRWEDRLQGTYAVRSAAGEATGREELAARDQNARAEIHRALVWLGPAWTPARRDLMVRAYLAERRSRRDEAIELHETLREQLGSEWSLPLREALVSLLSLRAGDGVSGPDPGRARADADRAVELGEEVADDPAFPASPLPRALVFAHVQSGFIDAAEGRRDDELRHVERAVALVERVRAKPDADVAASVNMFAGAYERRAMLHERAGEWEAVRLRFQDAIALRTGQVAPTSGLGQLRVLWAWAKCGDASWALGERDRAEREYRQAVELGMAAGTDAVRQSGLTLEALARAHARRARCLAERDERAAGLLEATAALALFAEAVRGEGGFPADLVEMRAEVQALHDRLSDP